MNTGALFHIVPGPGEPAYRQLVQQVGHALTTGALQPGDRLPTVRALARVLGLNPNTVARAYRELEGLGVLEARPGRGTFTKAPPPRAPAAERQRRMKPLVDRLVSEGRLLGLSDTELRMLLLKTLREHRVIRVLRR